MNYPSVKNLMQIKDVTRPDALKVLAILYSESVDAVTELSDAALDYVRQCYNQPPLQLVKLTAIDSILHTYGVERIPHGHGANSPAIEYCNTGDSYALTVLWCGGRYRVASWGDIVERGNYD
jgi:hypothetical protein